MSMSDHIFWELLRYEENKNGRFYRIVDTAETSVYDPSLPEFENQQSGDILLGHKDSGLEAYVVE